jgi:hypothetical protein
MTDNSPNDALAEQLVQFAESGNQQRVQLKNGQVIQGWVMEITEHSLQISSGYSDSKSSAEPWIAFDQLDLEQLYYWDVKQDQWLNFAIQP